MIDRRLLCSGVGGPLSACLIGEGRKNQTKSMSLLYVSQYSFAILDLDPSPFNPEKRMSKATPSNAEINTTVKRSIRSPTSTRQYTGH